MGPDNAREMDVARAWIPETIRPIGAVNGTLSHAIIPAATTNQRTVKARRSRRGPKSDESIRSPPFFMHFASSWFNCSRHRRMRCH